MDIFIDSSDLYNASSVSYDLLRDKAAAV